MKTLFLILFFLLPRLALAAITAEGTASSDTTSGTSLSFTHDSGASGTNCMTVVGIYENDSDPGNRVTSVTYNSVAMTLKQFYVDSNAGNIHLSLYYKLAPFRGSASVAITHTANDRIIAGAQTYCGVDQATPFGTAVTTSFSSTTTITSDVTSAAGELVIDLFGETDATAVSVGGGQSQLWQINNVRGAGMSTEAGAGTVTMSWTGANGSELQAQIAIAIKPTGAGGGVARRRIVTIQ